MNRKRIWTELDTAEVIIRIDDEYRDVFVHETCSTRQCCAILSLTRLHPNKAPLSWISVTT